MIDRRIYNNVGIQVKRTVDRSGKKICDRKPEVGFDPPSAGFKNLGRRKQGIRNIHQGYMHGKLLT